MYHYKKHLIEINAELVDETDGSGSEHLSIFLPDVYTGKASVEYSYFEYPNSVKATATVSVPDYDGTGAVFTASENDFEIEQEKLNDACNVLTQLVFTVADQQSYKYYRTNAGITGFGFVAMCEGHEYGSYTDPATLTKSGTSKNTVCFWCAHQKAAGKKTAQIKSVTLSKTAFYYNGKVQTPKVTVKDINGKVLKEKTDYTIAYSKGRKKVGQYSVVVTFKGKYGGSKTLYYTINPNKTAISKMTAGKKTVNLKWKKVVGVSGYQIQYADNATFKNAKKINVKGAVSVTARLKNLLSGKPCYVRVRTYKATAFKNKTVYVYSGWTNVKAVKVK